MSKSLETLSSAIVALELPLGGSRAWLIWGLAVAFVVYLFNAQTSYAVLSSRLQQGLNLTIGQVALVASTYTWAFAIAQLFGGALLDRLGAKKVLVPAVMLLTLGIFIFGLAQDMNMLILSQIVIAIGSSVGFVGAGYLGGNWFGMARFGVMFGYVQVVASLMSAVGQPVFEFSLSYVTWREMILFGGFCGIMLSILCLLFLRNRVMPVEPSGRLAGDLFKSILQVLKVPQVWNAALWGAFTFGGQLALGVVWAPRLLAVQGVDISLANAFGGSMVWLGLAIGCLFWNSWSDKIHSRKIPSVIGNLLQLFALLGVLYLPLNSLLGFSLLFLYGMGNAAHILAFTTAAESVPKHLVGTSASIVNGLMFILGGLLIDLPARSLSGVGDTLAHYQTGFLPLLILIGIGVVLSVVMRETFSACAD